MTSYQLGNSGHNVAKDWQYDIASAYPEIINVLTDNLTAKGIGQFLHARNRILSAYTPREVLESLKITDGHEQVHVAASAFVEGIYI